MTEESKVAEAEHCPKPHSLAGTVGEHLCKRCGWRWDTQRNRPNPPLNCARCRSSRWQFDPIITTAQGGRRVANQPNDPKWQTERDETRKRRRERRRKKLAELALEFGMRITPEPPPLVPPPPRVSHD